MSPEKDETLCQKYPEIFRDRHGAKRKTAMCWGFECGDGWYDILDRLCARLIELADAEYIPEIGPRWVPVATQVKEKFGTLRFYVNGASDAQYEAISEACRESGITCEKCGKAGSLRGGSWLYTACDEHTKPGDLAYGSEDGE